MTYLYCANCKDYYTCDYEDISDAVDEMLEEDCAADLSLSQFGVQCPNCRSTNIKAIIQ